MKTEIITNKTAEMSVAIAAILNAKFQAAEEDTAGAHDLVRRALSHRQLVEHGICVRTFKTDGSAAFVTDEYGILTAVTLNA